MTGSFILDTNILIRLFAADEKIIENIKKSDNIFIPVFVLGELFYGAYNSKNRKSNLEKILKLQNSADVLESNVKTAKIYGEIKSELKKSGKPIPENDIWIAAISLQHKLPLVTSDIHFKNIPALRIVTW